MFKNNASDRSTERSEFERLLEEEFSPSTQPCSAYTTISATTVKVTKEGAFIAIPGKKTESFIPANELPSALPLIEGEKNEFLVISEAGEDGDMKLSFAWSAARQLMEKGKYVQIVVKHLREDGADVVISELGNLTAFVFASQLPASNDAELKLLINQTLTAKIREVDILKKEGKKPQRRLVVSPLDAAKDTFLKSLKEGQIVKAAIRKVAETFAVAYFKESGITGLIIGSEFAPSGAKEDLSQAKTTGEEIELQVMQIDFSNSDKPGLKLSRRRVLEPFARKAREEFAAQVQVNDVVTARITNIPDQGWGAFALINESIVGFIDRRELPVNVRHAGQFLAKDQIVKARFIGVHAPSGNWTLSLKGVPQ